jgi:uncharacterized DUF497 family protein
MDESQFEWCEEKNRILKAERNLCFEDVVLAIQNGQLLDIIHNPSRNHPEQMCLIVAISGYAHIVPFVRVGKVFFLKTIYPSRKQTQKYLKES